MIKFDISVILPCYNGADTLSEQFEALARQSMDGPWEVVFVNNGSTDSSALIAESYRGRVPNLRIIHASPKGQPLGGVDYSYSVGFAAAQGRAFLLCESDDVAGDNWLSVMSQRLKSHDFVGCAVEYKRLNSPEHHDDDFQTVETGFPRMVGPLFLPFSTGAAMGLRREVWEKIGDPAEGAKWDVDFSWRAQQAGFTLTFVPETVMHYRQRASGRARFKQAKLYGRTTALMHRKYGKRRPVRALIYAGATFVGALTRMAVGVVLRRRPASYYAWDIGHSLGVAEGIPDLTRPVAIVDWRSYVALALSGAFAVHSGGEGDSAQA